MAVEKTLMSQGGTKIYKMRDLNQRTAEVIQEINDSGRPALITRHGRFVAVITPLMNTNFEGELIARLMEEHEAKGGSSSDEQKFPDVEPRGRSTGEMAARLGIDLDPTESA